ncbi:hypothetical protein Ndes2526B_g05303 [Nannochloris sp. 'desiccata']|nr:hypothetical protein KSW81_006337 [Chlorella desiccata (nom. nud.)]
MENNSIDAGPSSARDQESGEVVLNEVLVNRSALRQAVTTGQPTEDQDLALAKLLQEQERAFLSIAGIQGPAENVPPAFGQEDSLERSPSPGDSTEARPLTDEELAWKLMQEEEAEFQRRMMAFAGVQYPGISPRGHGAAARAEGAEDDSNFNSGDEDGGGEIDSDDDIPDPDSMSYEELTALGEVVGTVSTGLTQAQIDSLPVMKYLEVCCGSGSALGELKKEEEEEQQEEQCAVCRVEFEAEDKVKKLPCGHYYHPECVGQWLQQKKICPQCSREVTLDGGSGGASRGETTGRPPLAAVAPAAVMVPRND